jgi:hypothetical protein
MNMPEQLNRAPQPYQAMAPSHNQNTGEKFAQDLPKNTGESKPQRQQVLEDWRALVGGEEYRERVKTLKCLQLCHLPVVWREVCVSRATPEPPLLAHQPPQKYVCTHGSCGKAFGQNLELANHVEYAYSDGRYMIEFKYKECRRNFALVAELNIHQASEICFPLQKRVQM